MIAMLGSRPALWTAALLTALLPFDAPILRAADSPPPEASKPNRAAIEALILQLRSPNKDPNPDMQPGRILLPSNYSETQKKVEAARHKLLDLGKDAFPALIDHLTDKEYSRTVPTAIYRSLSVGDVCFTIIRDQIEPDWGRRCKSRVGGDGQYHCFPRYFDQYCKSGWYSQEGMRIWWKENQHKSLRQMQIKAVRYVIQEDEKIGFPDQEERDYWLKPLQERLRALTKE